MIRICTRALCLSLLLATSLLCHTARAQQPGREAPLKNNDVIKLVRAGFQDKTVIAIISTRQTDFDLSPDRLIQLKKSGVSEKIIVAMIARTDGATDWDDLGTDDDITPLRQPGQGQSGSSDLNIFGTNGDTRSRSQSRGGRGNASDDTVTTGSASARIIRPPLEAGGGPKLEKTPALTNNAIVELVEAGFSDGTIIRRIENSPVDFDLSPAKVADLKRRHVSESIINAMQAAMRDEDAPGSTSSGPKR